MGSRTLPIECHHGTTVDYGDFGPCQDCAEHDWADCPNFVACEQCLAEEADARLKRIEDAVRVVGRYVGDDCAQEIVFDLRDHGLMR